MNKLVRYWNQNREKILITISVIVLLFLIIQVLNGFIKREKEKNILENNNKINNSITTDIEKPNQAIYTDEKLSSEKVEKNSNLIKKFVEACNKKNIEIAYNMLSEDCKNEIFNNKIENFKEEYVDKIFKTNISYELELCYNILDREIYRIIYNEGSPLETGNINNENNFLDYVSVLREKNKDKLNVNKFIKKQIINKSDNQNGVNIVVENKKIFWDYLEYSVIIENFSNGRFLKDNNSKIYFIDKYENIKNSNMYELSDLSFDISQKNNRKINIRLNQLFTNEENIRYIVFENFYVVDKENNIDKVSFKIKV